MDVWTMHVFPNPVTIDDFSKQDFIGKAEFTLADIVTTGKGFTKDLTSPC